MVGARPTALASIGAMRRAAVAAHAAGRDAAGADAHRRPIAASCSCATPVGDGPVVMLLHGWVASADLNWCGAYDALAAAGYRVLAIDHRGHGRGLRPLVAVPADRLRRRRRRRAAGRSAPRRRSSSATRWAARSPSWWRATTSTSSAGSCLERNRPALAGSPRRAVPSRRSAWSGVPLSVAPRCDLASRPAPRRPGRLAPRPPGSCPR